MHPLPYTGRVSLLGYSSLKANFHLRQSSSHNQKCRAIWSSEIQPKKFGRKISMQLMILSAMINSENWIVSVISHWMARPTSACNSNNLVLILPTLHQTSSWSNSIKLITLISDFHWVRSTLTTHSPEKTALGGWHLNNLGNFHQNQGNTLVLLCTACWIVKVVYSNW